MAGFPLIDNLIFGKRLNAKEWFKTLRRFIGGVMPMVIQVERMYNKGIHPTMEGP